MARGRMNKADENKLQANIVFLKDNLRPNDILDHLLESNLIDFDQKDQITSEKTTSDKIDKLIQILRFAGQDSFQIFVECLQKCRYDYVAKRLCQGSSTKTATENDSPVKTELVQNASETSILSSATKAISCRHTIDPTCQNEADSFHYISDEGVLQQEEFGSPGYEEIGDVSPESNYDSVDFAKSTSSLILKTPLKESAMNVSGLSNKVQLSTDPIDLPGWCPNINDINHQKAVNMLEDGGYFFWYSNVKNAYIITLRTNQHKDGRIYVKVKTRIEGSEKLYRITRGIESTSPEKLFELCIENGLPSKFINK